MNPQNPFKSAIQPPIQNELSVMQPGEKLIFEAKRHPIGMLGMYIMAGFLIIALAVFAFGVAPSVFSSFGEAQVQAIGVILVLTAVILIAIFLFISNKVYWGNSWILTSDSLVQVTQTSLFDKKSSQLSLEHLEDIGAQQNGILPHMFNYGVITAESAGATDTFTFNYCPNPNYYARLIVAAREQLVYNQEKGIHPVEPQIPTDHHDQTPPTDFAV
jgi:hypothetical protein